MLKRPSLKLLIEIPLLIVLYLFLAYIVTGYYIIPFLGKKITLKKINELLSRQATIENLEFNPFTWELIISNFKIFERDGNDTWIEFRNIYVDFDPKSIKNLTLITKEIKIYQPFIRIIRTDFNTYNFSDLLIRKQSGRIFHYSLNNIKISDAFIDFNDIPQNIRHKMEDINISIPFISNIPKHSDVYTEPEVRAKINNSPMYLRGKTKPFSHTSDSFFHIKLKDIQIPHYFNYFPIKPNFTISQGILNTDIQLSYANLSNNESQLNIEGKLRINNAKLRLDSYNDDFLSVNEINATITPNNLLKGEITIHEINIVGPETNIIRDKNNLFNFQDIKFNKESQEKRQNNKEKSVFTINIKDFNIKEGKINFFDHSLTEKFKVSFYPIDLSIKNFSNKDGKMSNLSLKLIDNYGEKAIINGKISINPFIFDGNVSFSNLQPDKYKPYYVNYLNKDISNDYVDGNATIYYSSKHIKITKINSLIQNLKIYDNTTKTENLIIENINLKNLDIFPNNKEINLESLSLLNANINTDIDKNGKLSILDLLKNKEKTNDNKEEKKEGWKYNLGELEINNLKLDITDNYLANNKKINLDIIETNIKNITSDAHSPILIDTNATIFQKGQIKTTGSLKISPLDGNFTLNLTDIPVRNFQDYLSEIINIIVVKGDANFDGSINFNIKKGEKPEIFLKGKGIMKEFKILDGFEAQEIISFQNLQSHNLNLHTSPLRISVDEVDARKLKSKLIVDEDGKTNFHKLFVNKKEKKGEKNFTNNITKEENNKNNIFIKRISLFESDFFFLDKRVKPHFRLSLSQLEGNISGLETISQKPAKINFTARADGYSPVRITGDLISNPEDFYADLSINLNSLEMTSLSPYSGKYLGYTISKGKLDLETQYKVHKNILNIDSKIFFDQLDFGEEVKSPDAPSLPLRLAISLLKNRKGEIYLNMPITGNLKDPEFSLGGVILKMIVNLVKKVITSPFSFIASMFGERGEINKLTFIGGKSEPDDESLKKLDILAKALYDRPAVKIDILSNIEKNSEAQGIIQNKLLRILKAQKLKDIMGSIPGDIDIDFDKMTISDDEYEKYLWLAYKSAPFEKPKILMTLTKKLPREEMEMALKNHIKLTDEDFRELAEGRINFVREFLIKKGNIEPERIFLLHPVIKDEFNDRDITRGVEIKVK